MSLLQEHFGHAVFVVASTVWETSVSCCNGFSPWSQWWRECLVKEKLLGKDEDQMGWSTPTAWQHLAPKCGMCLFWKGLWIFLTECLKNLNKVQEVWQNLKCLWWGPPSNLTVSLRCCSERLDSTTPLLDFCVWCQTRFESSLFSRFVTINKHLQCNCLGCRCLLVSTECCNE